MNNSILNINVSSFASCEATIPQNVNLLTWLTSEKHRAKVEQLRTIQDEDLQKAIKTSLPAITPSGVFSYRAEKDLIEHSGFLAFDIDFEDNRHISNFPDLREQISHISSVAYCGLSVRGKGFWGLVPIPKSCSEVHKQRFSALAKDFKEFGIVLDASGSDVCRLRIYSWDKDGYFNHNAKLYTKLLRPQQKTYPRPSLSDTRDRVEAIISQIKERRIDITEDYKEGWLKIASALANEFGESGRGYFHTVSMFHPKYNIKDTDRMFDGCLKHNYNRVTIASFFQISSDHDIKLNPESVMVQPVTRKTMVLKPREMMKSNVVPKRGPWDQDITELERFFDTAKLPPSTMQLNQCTKILDVSKCVESLFGTVKVHNGMRGYLPYLGRLREIKDYLTNNLN